MAIVTGLTDQKIFELDSVAIVSGEITANGMLVLHTRGGSSYVLGNVKDSSFLYGNGVPPATLGGLHDTYINLDNVKFYYKDDTGTWVEKVQLMTKMNMDLALYYLGLRIDALENPPQIPHAAMYRSGAFSLSAGVTTCIPMTANFYTPTGGVTLNSIGGLKVSKAGVYSVSGNITFAASTSGVRRIAFINKSAVDGSLGQAITGSITSSAQSTAALSALSVSAQVRLEANDNVLLCANAAAAWDLDASQPYMNTLSISYSGP